MREANKLKWFSHWFLPTLRMHIHRAPGFLVFFSSAKILYWLKNVENASKMRKMRKTWPRNRSYIIFTLYALFTLMVNAWMCCGSCFRVEDLREKKNFMAKASFWKFGKIVGNRNERINWRLCQIYKTKSLTSSPRQALSLAQLY